MKIKKLTENHIKKGDNVSSMKWERPELKSMNAIECADAGCANGSGNNDLGGCTNGGINQGYRYEHGKFDGACAQGNVNTAG